MWTVMCTHVYVGRHRHTQKLRQGVFFALHPIKIYLFFSRKNISRNSYFILIKTPLLKEASAHLIMRCNPFHGQYFGLLGLLNLSLWPYLFKSSFETGLA
jgi:hypothetical protein